MQKYYFFVVVFFAVVGCVQKEKPQVLAESSDIPKEENISIEKEITSNNDVKKNIVAGENSITTFFFDGILNGNTDLSFQKGENGVINFLGNPIAENRIQESFAFDGRTVVEIYELVYDDFVHQYYVFESGRKLYSGFFINKKLDRLKLINIGDTSQKLLSTFADEYFKWDKYKNIKENISYTTDPVECEIQFVIKDIVIQNIWCNFFVDIGRKYLFI